MANPSGLYLCLVLKGPESLSKGRAASYRGPNPFSSRSPRFPRTGPRVHSQSLSLWYTIKR